MANRRDIELLISARDQTGRTFGNVAKSIQDLNRQIDNQIAAAGRGEIALDELRASQRALRDVGKDLSAIQGQIDGFRRLNDTLASNRDKMAAAEAAVAEYKRGIGDLGNATAAQQRKLESLEKKVQTTGQAVRKTEADLESASAALKQAGVDTNNLDAAQDRIVASAREAGAGFTALKGAISTYATDLSNARQQEANLGAQNALDRKIAEATRLGDASKFVRIYAQAIDNVALADQKIAALNGFRAVGQQAAEASRDVSRFVTAGNQMETAASEIAQGLRNIIQPGQEALRTLDGVEQAIHEAALAAEADKGSITDFSNAVNRLSESNAALLRLGASLDAFQDQAAKVDRARAAFDAAAVEVEQFGNAMRRADEPTEEMVRALTQAENKLNETGRALNVEETKLAELSRSLKQAGIDTKDLANAQDRLAGAATKAANGIKAGNATLGRGGPGKGSLFGLDPFQLQQLSFQINDVVVGLASGQRPMTVLLQQGLQISQLFPKINLGIVNLLGALGPLLVIIGAIAAALAPFIIAFKVVGDKITETQQAAAKLDLRGITDIDPTALIKTGKAFEKVGASAEDAQESISKLLDEISDQEQFENVSAAVADMAKKLGIEVPEATDLMVGALTGGIEAAEDLALKTNLLTNEELDHIQALYDAGEAEEARGFITDTVTEKLERQASLTDGVFSPAVRNLKTAFSNLVNFFRDVAAPVLDWFQEKIKDAIVGFTFLTGLLAGKSIDEAGREAVGAVAPRRGTGGGGASNQDIRDRRYLRELKDEEESSRTLTREERLRKAAVDARRKAQEAGVSKGVEDLAVTQAIAAEERKIAEEAAKGAKRRGSARSRADREAAKLARQIDSAQAKAERQLRQLDAAVSRTGSANLAERLAAVDEKYESIYETLAKLRDLGVTALDDGTSLEEIERRVEAGKDILKQNEQIAFYEEQINLLTKQRQDEVQNIADAQERGALGVTEAFRQAEAVNGRITPQIIEAAQKALDIARAVAGTNPSPEMISMIARLERIIGNEPTNDVATGLLSDAFGGQEEELNRLLSERNDLVQAYNQLRDLGLRTDEEARRLAQDAYTSSAPAIQDQVNQMRATLETLRATKDELTGLPLISDAAYNAWLAKLEAVEAGLTKVDERIVAVNQAAQNAIAQGITNAFQTAANSIVGLINGTKSWGDVLDDVFTTALQFAADFLSAIAQVLVQMVALQAAKAIIGGSTGGLGGLFFHSGGIVGSGGSTRKRTGDMGSWLGAPKFHTGGGLGLRPNEYKAVLEKGEEVLTEDDPRHIRNQGKGGGGGGAGQAIRQVLLMEPEQVSAAMQTRSGEKAVLTILKANKPTIKQILG